MPRPRKWRKVKSLPKYDLYGPKNQDNVNDRIIYMTVEEYEMIRLIDYMKLTQEECAQMMNVARATIQYGYALARLKLAQALIEGAMLKIAGGNFSLDTALPISCQQNQRHRNRRHGL
ncbi:MAG: DUF134 domain-containing protein [Erysipelotrichaceae bacterium]|nr:DUF134 domain-containing protein [Erysipelotrichaceae bacterium]